MTRFAEHAEAALVAQYAEFGEAATYTPPGGNAIDCTIITDLRDAGSRPHDGRPIAGQITIEVRASEVAAPAQGGIFTFDGRTATVMNRPWPDDDDGLVWKMWAT